MEEDNDKRCTETVDKKLISAYIELRCQRARKHDGNHMVLFNEPRDGSTGGVPLQWSTDGTEKQEEDTDPAPKEKTRPGSEEGQQEKD